MKKLLTLLLISLCCIQVLAQSGPEDKMVTNVLNFSWMPDGSAFCFSVIRHDFEWKHYQIGGIFKIDLKTGEVSPLTENASNPAISPDGKTMAYEKRDGNNTDIYLYDFMTKKEKPLLTDTLRETAPSWSPDGKKLAYTVMTNRELGRQQASLDIWVMDISTGKKKQITTSSHYKNYNPVWAPTGNKIVYYLEKGDSHDQIWLTDENGSFHTNITADTTTHNYYPSWLGEKIIYSQSPNNIILTRQDGSTKSVIEDLPAFWAIYNAKSDKIAYLSQATMQKPSEFRTYDLKTKASSLIISNEVLNEIELPEN